MTSDLDRVVVVGAGIGGLATARALHRRGIPVLVLDRLPGPPDAGLALNLPGNAVQAFGALGIAADLGRLGTPIRRREYRSDQDRLLFAVDEGAFWSGGDGSRCVRRQDLLDALGQGLPAGTVRWETAVTWIEPTPKGVDVRLDDGTVLGAGFVVGADGVHSTVRSTAFGDAADGGNMRTALLSAASWRFMTTRPTDPGIDCWTVWSGARGTFLLIPVDGGQVYGFASATRGGPVSVDPQWLRTTFEGFPDPVPRVVDGVLAEPASLYHSPVEEVRIPEWTSGRTVLIGDAAHATAPVWAQGAAMAAEDALVLAELLAEHDDWDLVGQTYERRRRPRVTHVQSMTDRLSKTAALPIRVRNLLLPRLGPRTFDETYGPLRTLP
jgi:2-polyprenyl-6-methoxyphenol hydroxylase-like FAD-dependent oxidoreductase